jgi:hypothetical protein
MPIIVNTKSLRFYPLGRECPIPLAARGRECPIPLAARGRECPAARGRECPIPLAARGRELFIPFVASFRRPQHPVWQY